MTHAQGARRGTTPATPASSHAAPGLTAAGLQAPALNPLWAALSFHTGAAGGIVQRTCAACAAGGTPCDACAHAEEDEGHTLQARLEVGRTHARVGTGSARAEVPLAATSPAGPGRPGDVSGGATSRGSLPPGLRAGLERLSGIDLSGVQVYRNSPEPNRIGALAYAHGRDIHVGPGQDRHLPHEGWHVVQQMQGRVRGTTQVGGVTVNDDAGLEHEAEAMGSVALRSSVAVPPRPVAGRAAGRALQATVQRYDTPEHAQFGEAGRDVTVAGVTMTQGEMITMADFFADVAQMEANPDQVRAVLAAIRSGRAGTAEWMEATGGRYATLALDNEGHFAPSNASLVPPGGGGRTDHYRRFATGHIRALMESAMGRQDSARAYNSFAGHFLTDAFSSGHIVNKADVMHRFATRLRDRTGFLDAVAASAWRDPRVRRRMSIRETTSFPNLNFDSEWMFSRFLRGIDEQRPDVVPNSVAKVVHDALNQLAEDPAAGGLAVTNARGDTWRLSGDETLSRSPDTLRLGREAVAQSNANVDEVAGIGTPALTTERTDELLARVWAFVPRPTEEGEAQVVAIVEHLTDPTRQETIDTLGRQLAENIGVIIEAAEAEGAIRVEPPGVVEEIGREASRALDWREWARLAYP